MELPRINPVGLVEHPEGYVTAPRQYPFWLRSLVLVLLLIFGGVTVITTVISLGSYCLTTNTSDLRNLPEAYRQGGVGESAP